MSVYSTIRQAAIDKKTIVITYNGLERIMCPHVVGKNRNGRLHALCYQFAGRSKDRPIEADGSPNNWRCIDIEKISTILVRDGDWHTAANNSRPQTCVAQIDFEVQS
jgi:hypothetical protein